MQAYRRFTGAVSLKTEPQIDRPTSKHHSERSEAPLNAGARLLRGLAPRNDKRSVIASEVKQSGETGSAGSNPGETRCISRHSGRNDETIRSGQGDILRLISQCPDDNGNKKASPDWQDIIKTAGKEGLFTLLYKDLKGNNGLLPQEYREKLRQEYFVTLAQNKYYFRELARCLKVVEVPVILLKGAALLPTVYGDLGERPLGDFDILIHHRDLERVKGRLGTLGYKPHGGSGLYVNSVYFMREDAPVLPLEVHWHVENSMFPNFDRFKIERMWQAAIPVEIEGCQGLIFAPHHQLIHLSVHALRHSYDRLLLLWDMHRVINYYGDRLDWEGLMKDASEFYLSRPLYYGLYLTKRLLNTDIPQHVLDRLRPRSLGIEERAFVYLINRGVREHGLQYLVYFPMNRGMSKKMKFFWWALFPPRGVLAEMEALDDSEIGVIHYLRCIVRRFKSSLRLLYAGKPR